MLEKVKQIPIEIVITPFILFYFFLNSCLVWKWGMGRKEKQNKTPPPQPTPTTKPPKGRGGVVLEHFKFGNKMVSCEPNDKTVAFDEQRQCKLCPRVIS